MKPEAPARALRATAGICALALVLGGCSREREEGPPVAADTSAVHAPSGATANLAPNAPAGQWTMQGRDYANTRYSPLTQVNAQNVKQLEMAWTFSDGVLHGHEGQPLVVGSTMYLVTPFPNIAYALDLSKPGHPIKWTYKPAPTPIAIGKACCDVVIRGWAYDKGKLFYNLLDDHVVAVDAETGKEVWRTQMANVENGATMTMSPLVANGKVYVGNSGGEMGVEGWLAALDENTGKELWRAYSVGPDSMVRIGPDFHPYYKWMQGKDLGVSTWPADAWKHGAGAPWGWVTYDPETNTIFYGTSNTGPWNAAQRPGLNLWTSTVFARDADTGMAKWAYAMTPHNEWDYDAVNENILATLPVDGKLRKVMVQFNRNGFAYTIDRQTGQVLVAAPFGHENWSTGVDLKTGLPRVVKEKETVPPGKWVRDICPADIGVKDWQPAGFSPRTGLFYVPVQNICMDYLGREVSYIAGTPYWGAEMERHVGPGGQFGALIAWDASTGKRVWSIPEKFLVYSGVLVTGSDLVFYGTVDGWFRAADARTGKVLWSKKLGSGIISPPMTYLGPDGRQYVAVIAGVGGGAMVTASQPNFPPRGGTLYVFSVGGEVERPSPTTPTAPVTSGPQSQNPTTTNKGKH